jgi:sugar phosphate isomerase/epimerase
MAVPELALSSLCVAGRATAWAAVAAEARGLGFDAIECLLPGPEEQRLPPRGFAAHQGVQPRVAGWLPGRFAGLTSAVARGAASPDPARRLQAVAAISTLAAAATVAGIALVVLPAAQRDPEDDPTVALDGLCRTIHAVREAHPAVRLALTGASGPAEAPGCSEVELIAGDVGGIEYWHDVSVAETRADAGGADARDWLDLNGGRCAGLALSDHDGTNDYLPPGSGRVDWTTLREQAPRAALRVVRVDPRIGVAALPAALDCLKGAGLA